MSDVRLSAIERHAPTVLASIITALLVWIGYTTQQTAIGVARLQIQIEGISVNTERLDRLEGRLLDIEKNR